MAYITLITTLGLAKIAAAISNASTVNLYEMAVGDGNGNPTTPNVSQTALVREVYRSQLNTLKLDPNNPNYMITEMVVPVGVGGWSAREIGLYDNAGALIAVGNFPDTYKPLLSEGAGRDLVIRMVIEVANPGVITLTIDPGIVLATRQWVSDNFTLAIVLPGGTTGEVLRKASNADGDYEWYDPTSGLNLVVNSVKEEQTLAASQTVVNLAIATTPGAALYVEGLRLFSDDYTVNSDTQITLATSYPAGYKILAVQNDPLSTFSFLGTDNHLAEIAAAGAGAQAAAAANLGLAGNATLLTAIRASVFGALFPIGEIYVTRRAGAPNTWLGFGTWERYGAGRVIAGFDANDSAFNTLDGLGGEKTHTITVNELPSHIHQVDPPSTATSSNGNHTHEYGIPVQSGGSTNMDSISDTPNADERYTNRETGAAGVHTHTVDIAPFNSGAAGGSQAMNNLQPYIVAFMWKRTA